MDEAKAQFILGVIAPEGTFHGAISEWESGISVTPSFQVRLTSERDSSLVKKMHEETGIGRVEENDGMTGWVVSNKQDAQDLVEWVENRSSALWEASDKSQAFNEWKKMVRLLKGYTKSDWKKGESSRDSNQYESE